MLKFGINSDRGEIALGFYHEYQVDVDAFSEDWVDILALRWTNQVQRDSRCWGKAVGFLDKRFTLVARQGHRGLLDKPKANPIKPGRVSVVINLGGGGYEFA